MEEEDLSNQVGFFIRCSKLKVSTKSYKFLSSEILFKSPTNTFSNVTKYIESLQDKLSDNIDLLFLEVHMHLLSVFYSNGSLYLGKEFHYYLCEGLVFLENAFIDIYA